LRVSEKAGFNRFAWDMRYDPIGVEDPNEGDDAVTGSVPHATYSIPYAPWAPPGNYTVRLKVDGQTYTQPLTLRLEPREKTPAPVLSQLATLTRSLDYDAVAAHEAYDEARALAAKLGADAALRARIDSIAPPGGANRVGRGGRGGGRGGAAAPGPTFESTPAALINAAMAMQDADVAPTTGQLAAATKARADQAELMRRWNAIKRQAGVPARP
jgi:hypothetical protein